MEDCPVAHGKGSTSQLSSVFTCSTCGCTPFSPSHFPLLPPFPSPLSPSHSSSPFPTLPHPSLLFEMVLQSALFYLPRLKERNRPTVLSSTLASGSSFLTVSISYHPCESYAVHTLPGFPTLHRPKLEDYYGKVAEFYRSLSYRSCLFPSFHTHYLSSAPVKSMRPVRPPCLHSFSHQFSRLHQIHLLKTHIN